MAQVVGYSEISISEYADGAGLYDSIPYYLASSQSEGVTIYDEGWSREVPVLTPEEKYLWIYYVSRYSAGTTEPEILTVYGNPAVVEYEGDDAPADKVLVEIEPDIAQGMDQTPYIYRAVSDSSVTDLKNHEIISEITGGTVAWNQLVQNGDFADTSVFRATNGTFTVSGNVMTFTGNSASNTPSIAFQHTRIANHKYLMTIDVYPQEVMSAVAYLPLQIRKENLPANTWTRVSGLAYLTTDGTSDQSIYFNYNGQNNGKVTKFRNYMLIDLTQLFGSTIADYIYSLEQSTAGAGVSLFKSLFPKDYYAYNAGELLSVKTSARETVVKNLLPSYINNGSKNGATWVVNNDKSIVVNGTATALTDIPVIDMSKNFILPVGDYIFSGGASNGGNTNLYIAIRKKSAGSDRYVLINNDTPTSFSITEDDKKLSVAIRLYANQTYSDMVWKPMIRFSSATDSAYEPYQKHTYPLSNIELRGIPKLVNNKIQYDGDIYKADGSVTRRIGVTQTTNPYHISNEDTDYLWRFQVYVVGTQANGTQANAIGYCFANFPLTKFSPSGEKDDHNTHICPFGHSTSLEYRIWVSKAQYPDYDNALAFTKTFSFLTLLSSPTTETTTPYTETQICDADGTEEFIDDRDVQIPVGHKTSYIQAYDDIHMEHWGKNLCPTFTSGTFSGLTATVNSDGSVRITGTNTGTAFKAVEIKLSQGTYKLNGSAQGGQLILRNALGGGAPSSAFSGTFASYNGEDATFSVSETATAWLNIRVVAGTHDDLYYPMIRLADTSSDYEPYYHENLSFSLGEPVYGGTVDVANYKTTKKYGITVIDENTSIGQHSSGDTRFYTPKHDMKRQMNYLGYIKCNKLQTTMDHTHLNENGFVSGYASGTSYIGQNWIYFSNGVATTIADIKTWLASNPLTVIYELAEPEESTFQP